MKLFKRKIPKIKNKKKYIEYLENIIITLEGLLDDVNTQYSHCNFCGNHVSIGARECPYCGNTTNSILKKSHLDHKLKI